MFKKCALFVVFLHVGLLFSTSATWIAPATPADWDVTGSTGNWTPATPPGGAAGDQAKFTSPSPPIPANPIVNLVTANTIIGELDIDSATNYTFQQMGVGTLNFAVGSGSASLKVTASLGNGAHTFTVPISLTNSLVVSQGSSGNLTISSAITGAAGQSLTLSGTGTLVLSGAGANTYGGGTFINGGILSITADNKLGSPLTTAVTIGSGTLQIDGTFATSRTFPLTGGASISVTAGNTATINGVISGSGSLTKTNSGILILTATNNTYQSGTVIGAGTLSISSDANLGNSSGALTIGSGTLLTTAGISSARSGSFTGAAIIDTNGLTSTLSGNFGGGGSLAVINGGTLILIGSNNYTGPTVVGAGTHLSGTTNGIQGPITLNTPTSLLTFSQNFDGTYSGILTSAVVNAGSITKLGSGAVTFTNASPNFSGPVSINEGTLIVNGSIANSQLVTVLPSGTLGGSGTVGPTTSTGTLDPGNGTTIGTLSVNGTLVLMAGSRTIINIAPLISDRIAVSGMATITGPLTIDPIPAFYGFSVDDTILTSSALAGTFFPVTTTAPSFVPTVTYTGTDALLHIVISQPFAIFPFSNQNTAAVGHNIDEIHVAGQLSQDLFNLFNSLVGQSNETINAALDEMHPAQYSAFTEMQAEARGQLISLFHRLPYLPCSCNRPNRLWIEGFGNTLTMKRHGLEIGFQANSGGIAFGYDGQITDSFILGFGGAWSNNHLDWHDHRGHGDLNGLYGGVYFDSQVGSFYFGGSGLVGMDFYDTSRHIQFVTIDRRASAEYKALDVMAQIATAYLFGSPQAFFYPYANFDYFFLHTHKFSEKGANGLDLTVFDHTDSTLRTEMGLGLQVQDRNAAETVCISPLISLGWVNMCPIERPKLEAAFQGATIPFKVLGWDESWNLLNIRFALSIAYRCYSFGLQYNVEFSPDHETLLFNQNADLRIDWKW